MEKNPLKQIDSTLKYVRRFKGTVCTCKVEKENLVYILKFAKLHGSCKQYRNLFELEKEYVKKESRVLKLSHNIEGITRLIHDYGEKSGYIAILKEFFEGNKLDSLGLDFFKDKQIYWNLKQTIDDLHSKGIARLDLNKQNILYDNKKDTKLFDFGSARLREEIGKEEFEKLKNLDLEGLEFLFSGEA